MRTDRSAAPGAETEGRAVALKGTARTFLRDRHLCDKPSRPEAATKAAWSRTVFPYVLPHEIPVHGEPRHRLYRVRNNGPIRAPDAVIAILLDDQ